MALLKRDIWSIFSRYGRHGRAGEEVKIIADHGNVLIVESSTGFRYAAPTADVDQSEEAQPQLPGAEGREPEKLNPGKRAGPKMKTAKDQGSLL